MQSYYDRLKDIAEEESETEKSAQPVAPAVAAISASTTAATAVSAVQLKSAQAAKSAPASAATGVSDSCVRQKATVGGLAPVAIPPNSRNPRKACLYTTIIHVFGNLLAIIRRL